MIEIVSKILVWSLDTEEPDMAYFNCTNIVDAGRTVTFNQGDMLAWFDKERIFKYQIVEEEI